MRLIRIHSFVLKIVAMMALTFTFVSSAGADPCGMVPPIFTGTGSAITRIGLQQTYVFFDRGVESFVIRPAFSGRVDNFGMLIPFPNPPAIRKVADDVFQQIERAIDPPEVVVDLRRRGGGFGAGGFGGGGMGGGGMGGGMLQNRLERNKVVVLKEEAVGMYEVAVLQAGSAKALEAWMKKNKFQYPKGMDAVTNEYIEQRWCFVAVKTKVAGKEATNPKPGQRKVDAKLPAGNGFDGAVQAMGFRFRTRELVVPMRLSAFNEGDLRNIVYLLSRGGKRIRMIPEEYVVRQIRGKDLVNNLTQPLPLRVIGGTAAQIPRWQRKDLQNRRDPAPHNGYAKQLFVDDIRGSRVRNLTLDHEEAEKDLLAVSEHFRLRGAEIDQVIAEANSKDAQKNMGLMMAPLSKYTLTVVDGDFPREVLAKTNLTFANFNIVPGKNRPESYDAKVHGPMPKKEGQLFSVAEPWNLPGEKGIQAHEWQFVNHLEAPIRFAGFGLMAMALMCRRRRSCNQLST